MGAGAAGSLMADRFATAGQKVVVLDAGPPWTLGDLHSSQIWARRLKWGGSPVLSDGPDRVGHNMSNGWGLGGAALHHYAGWPRLQPSDFTMFSDHRRGLDWPISYDDLRPHYDAVQEEVGISGDAVTEIWRPAGQPYPMPPLKSFAQGRIVTRGFEALGMTVSPGPMAVTSIEYKGRPACQYDGWCDAGCPTGALANPLVIHQPNATKAGAIFKAHSRVTGIALEDNGRARGLIYRTAEGQILEQPATLIVLAGAAAQNVRLLLATRHAKHQNGFSNRNGLLGKYFNAHNIANVHALFDEETECHLGLSAGMLTNQDEYRKARKDGPFGSYTWGIGGALKPNDLLGIAMTRADLFGVELDGFIDRASRHLAVINGIVESLPSAANRIELSSQRDDTGMQLARTVYALDPESRRLWAHANALGLRVMKAAGATESWVLPTTTFAHFSGGTIMGADSSDSVVNSFGQLYEAPNVMVAGGGQFPTIGAVSPTFTVLALAHRAASHAIAHPTEFDRLG